MKTRERFPELDLLRFLAACAVMLFHYTFRGPQDHAWQGSFPILSQIFKYGYLGVDVFFILSGFVILLTAYDKNALSFSIARVIRLYPAYWICLTLTAIAILLAGNARNHVTPFQYLANLTMAHSYFGIRDVSGVYWTLAVELKFYFLIFLMLALRQTHRMAFLLGLWLAASIFLSFRPPHGIARFFLFPEWSSYFIAGATFFLIHRHGPSLYKMVLIIGCYGLSIGYATNLLPSGAASPAFQVSAAVLIWMVTIFYLVFVALAFKPTVTRLPRPRTDPRPAVNDSAEFRLKKTQARGRSSQFLYLLGLITYPLYLIHQDVGYILLRLAPPALNRLLVLWTVCCIAIGLSLLIHLGPEKWLARWLKSLLASGEGIGSFAGILALEFAKRLRFKLWPTPVQTPVPVIGNTLTEPKRAHLSPQPSPVEQKGSVASGS